MDAVLLFSGQGAQKVGMGKDLYDQYPVAKALIEQADKALGESLSAVMFEGPILNGRITTTLAKAKALRPYVEKLITLAKRGDVHSRRLATATIHNTTAVKRLFDEIAPLCAERKGGYTRIVKLGQRLTDSALVAMIEIIDLPREAAEKEEAPATTEATA